jgi:hypothetical protein
MKGNKTKEKNYKRIITQLLSFYTFYYIHIVYLVGLRVISNAPWFVRNDALHTDFKIPTIKNYIRELSVSFFNKLSKASGLQHFRLQRFTRPNSRRLQRGRPHDVLNL